MADNKWLTGLGDTANQGLSDLYQRGWLYNQMQGPGPFYSNVGMMPDAAARYQQSISGAAPPQPEQAAKKEPAAEEGTNEMIPSIEIINGVRMLIIRDKDGNMIEKPTILDEQYGNAMTPYQQAQIGLQQQQMAQSQQQYQSDLAANPRTWIQSWYAKEYARAGRATSSSLSDKGWAGMTPSERGTAITLGQPYGFNDYGDRTASMLGQGFTDINTYNQALANAPMVTEGGSGQTAIGRTAGEFPVNQMSTADALALNRASKEGGSYQVQAPLTPNWLTNIDPRQDQQRLQQMNVINPSAQQWAAMPASVQQGYMGYSDWAGTPAEDVISSIKSSLSTGTESGSSRTSAKKQWA